MFDNDPLSIVLPILAVTSLVIFVLAVAAQPIGRVGWGAR